MRLALAPTVVAVEEDMAVAEKEKAVAEEDTAVAEKEKVVAEEDMAAAEEDKEVAEEGKGVVDEGKKFQPFEIKKLSKINLGENGPPLSSSEPRLIVLRVL